MVVNTCKFKAQYATPPDNQPINSPHAPISDPGNYALGAPLSHSLIDDLVPVHHKRQTQDEEADSRDLCAFKGDRGFIWASSLTSISNIQLDKMHSGSKDSKKTH